MFVDVSPQRSGANLRTSPHAAARFRAGQPRHAARSPTRGSAQPSDKGPTKVLEGEPDVVFQDHVASRLASCHNDLLQHNRHEPAQRGPDILLYLRPQIGYIVDLANFPDLVVADDVERVFVFHNVIRTHLAEAGQKIAQIPLCPTRLRNFHVHDLKVDTGAHIGRDRGRIAK